MAHVPPPFLQRVKVQLVAFGVQPAVRPPLGRQRVGLGGRGGGKEVGKGLPGQREEEALDDGLDGHAGGRGRLQRHRGEGVEVGEVALVAPVVPVVLPEAGRGRKQGLHGAQGPRGQDVVHHAQKGRGRGGQGGGRRGGRGRGKGVSQHVRGQAVGEAQATQEGVGQGGLVLLEVEEGQGFLGHPAAAVWVVC